MVGCRVPIAWASASGDIDGHKLQGSAHVAKTPDGGWRADNLALTLASARLDGNVAIGRDQLADGELNFSAANLDDLSPLVLTKMTGALQAKLSAPAADGKQAQAEDRAQASERNGSTNSPDRRRSRCRPGHGGAAHPAQTR
jgi:hypothetical protein